MKVDGEVFDSVGKSIGTVSFSGSSISHNPVAAFVDARKVAASGASVLANGGYTSR